MADEPNNQEDKSSKDKFDDAREKTSMYARYSSIAFQMLGTIGLGVWGGMKLDEWQGNQNPIWTIILSLTSIGASLYLFISQLPKQP